MKLVSSLVALVVSTALLAAGDQSAAAVSKPAWAIQGAALPTNLSSDRNAICEAEAGEPESCDHYTIVPTNIGATATGGAVTLSDVLPSGLKVVRIQENGLMSWTCGTELTGGHEVVICTSESEVPALTPGGSLSISVVVEPTVHGTVSNSIEISGGGAASTESAVINSEVGGAVPGFGPFDLATGVFDASGERATEAGAHPNGFTMAFAFPTSFSVRPPGGRAQSYPVEDVKQIVTDLPPGLVGDALSAPACSLYAATSLKEDQSECPSTSRVGRLALIEPGGGLTELTIFNVAPEHGYAAEFAVFLPGLNRAEMLYGRLAGTGARAHIRVVSAPQNSVALDAGVSLTFFGNPVMMDGGLASSTQFFTSPSDCASSGFTSTVYADSWQNPGRVEADGEPDLTDPAWKSASSVSPPVVGCGQLHFQPTFTLAPESGHFGADEPAGYESVLKIPQNEDPNGLVTPPLKRTVVTLPSGVAISPSAAVGLVGCPPGSEGIGLATEAEASQPGNCPSASKVGEVEAVTPVLKESLKGGVYVAQPSCGGAGQAECTEEAAETGKIFGLYLELDNENSGVHVKIRGSVEVGGAGHHNDLAPGQVRATFAETPQDPVSELKFKFNGGPKAPLANSQACGSETTQALLEPWSHVPALGEEAGTPNVLASSSFSIEGCEDKFAPTFVAGVTNPQAGAYSPVTVTFSRQDREHDLKSVAVHLAPYEIGKITGIPECGDAEASQGSCPAASRVGSATAAAGSGPDPLWQTGIVYFTGPYKGAPFGLSVVVPAKAGPYNLGNIVVRAALYIDPHTAQVTVVSDPLPQSIDGVPLRVKTVNATIDREGFALNPTDCSEQHVNATVESTEGAVVPVSSRFEVGNCAALGFAPKLAVSTAAKSSKASGASLAFKITYPNGAIGSQAWLKYLKLDIPSQLPARLTTLNKACLAAVFEANPAACPGPSLIGHAVVRTSLLPVPLVGPVYFVSYGGAKFPDVVMVLQGDGVTIDLTGETFINGKTHVTSATFPAIPGLPFESAEVTIPTGPYSEFAANLPAGAHGSFCGQKLLMPTAFKAQNGAEIHQSTRISVQGCSTKLAIEAHSHKGKTLTLTVYAPAAGKLKAAGAGLTGTGKNASGQEDVTMKLHIDKHGKTKVKLTFTPGHGRKQHATLTTHT